MNVETLQKQLKTRWPKIHICGTVQDFDKSYETDGLWVSAENSFDKDGLDLFDYWSEDYKEVLYVDKVRKPVWNFLQKNGYYVEWNDAGTVFIIAE